MASWSAAVAYTDAPPAERRRRPRPAASPSRDPLRNGVVWIIVAGIVLAGLVALNVAVLQLNVRMDQLSHERTILRDENAALGSQFSTSRASPLIQARARQQLGLVPATDQTYVELGKG
jgi:hypothetical protein